MSIFVKTTAGTLGPLSPDDFQKAYNARRFSLSDMAWVEGATDWQPVETLPQLLRHLVPSAASSPSKVPSPPPVPTAHAAPPPAPESRSGQHASFWKGLRVAFALVGVVFALLVSIFVWRMTEPIKQVDLASQLNEQWGFNRRHFGNQFNETFMRRVLPATVVGLLTVASSVALARFIELIACGSPSGRKKAWQFFGVTFGVSVVVAIVTGSMGLKAGVPVVLLIGVFGGAIAALKANEVGGAVR